MQSLLREQDIRDEAIEQGFEEGRKSEKIEMAKIGLASCIDIKTIMLMTGLSEEELNHLED